MWPGSVTWGGELAWQGCNTTPTQHVYMAFDSFLLPQHFTINTAIMVAPRTQTSQHPSFHLLLATSRPQLPSSPGRISCCRRRFRCKGQSAHHTVAVCRRGLLQRLTECRMTQWWIVFGGGGVCLAGVEAELRLSGLCRKLDSCLSTPSPSCTRHRKSY